MGETIACPQCGGPVYDGGYLDTSDLIELCGLSGTRRVRLGQLTGVERQESGKSNHFRRALGFPNEPI